MFATGPLRCILATFAAAAAVAMIGCGAGEPAVSSSGMLHIRGNVYGGQQPVANSTIYMYTPGTGGNGSLSNSIYINGVTSLSTDVNGNFNLTGQYTCANADDRAYMVAVGGNPGLMGVTSNPALVLMTALGRCGDLYTTAFVSVNELTTVAAAWTLAPFYTAYNKIGATSTNAAGIRNAFTNAALIVDQHIGQIVPPGANRTIESGKVYALANSISGCVNSDGTTGCSALFSAATVGSGAAPTNTLDAAVNIVRNPGNKVSAVYNAGSAFAPFPQVLSGAPNDWTLSMTITGAGMSNPTALGIDPQGTVWVASYAGLISAFTPQGIALSATGYGAGTLSQTYGLAVTPNGNVWATIQAQPTHGSTAGSLVRFAGASTANPGALQYGPAYDNTVYYPYGISADTDNSVFSANYSNATATHFLLNGTLVDNFGNGFSAFPIAVAVDASHGVWLANNGDSTVTHVSSTGTVLAHPSCCNAPNGIALDSGGNAWVSNYYGSSVSEVSAAGTVTIPPVTPVTTVTAGGVSGPAGLVIDGNQDVWVANYAGGTFSKLAGNNNATATAGTALSPNTGYGKDASLSLPFAIGADASGNLWISNYNRNDLVEFFGLTTPVATPVQPVPTAP